MVSMHYLCYIVGRWYMKLRENEKNSIKEQNAFTRLRKTLTEGLAVAVAACVLSYASWAYPQDRRESETGTPHANTAGRQRESFIVMRGMWGNAPSATVLAFDPATLSIFPESVRENLRYRIGRCIEGSNCRRAIGDGILGRSNNPQMEAFYRGRESFYDQIRGGNSVRNARVRFELLNCRNSRWEPIRGCGNVAANAHESMEFPSADGRTASAVSLYFAGCNARSTTLRPRHTVIFPPFFPESDSQSASNQRRVGIVRASFIPQPDDGISASNAEYYWYHPSYWSQDGRAR